MLFEDVHAVVVGLGGEKHLYPLTKLHSKPAVPIGGQFRLIDISISNCLNSGITRIFVLTQFLSASLHDHLNRTYQFSAFSGSAVEILATEETLSGLRWCQGTADAVRHQLHHILSRDTEDVLVLPGDHLYRMDLSELVRFHRDRQADVTITVLPVAAKDALHSDACTTNARGHVVAFRPEPENGQVLDDLDSRARDERSWQVPTGIYLFRADALARLLEENRGCDLGQHILPAAIRSRRIYAYLHKGYWEDLSSMSAFHRANLAMTHANPSFDLRDPRWPIYTRSRFLPPSRIDGCRMERTLVSDGCQLDGATIEESVIGLRSIVRPGARLSQVVMMGADFNETDEQEKENRSLGRPHVGIGRGTFVERAIIDKNVRIGREVFIGSHEGNENRDEALYAIRDGIVIIPENTIIPDGTTICMGPPEWVERLGQRHRAMDTVALAAL